MHLLRVDTVSLDEGEAAVDLGQEPGDLVILSFTDSDLAGLARAHGTEAGLPSLRLAKLAKLRHPLSVDLYVEKVIARARAVVIRCLGGLDYWRYGIERCAQVARAHGVVLAVLPGDDRPDPRLADFSTDAALADSLDGYFRAGGPENLRRMLRLLAERIGAGWRVEPAVPLPRGFAWCSGCGPVGLDVALAAGASAVPLELPYPSPNALQGTSPHSWDHCDTHPVRFPHPEVPTPVGLEGGLPGSQTPLEPSFEAASQHLRMRVRVGSAGATGLRTDPIGGAEESVHPLALLLVYRSAILGGDTAPFEALAIALRERGVGVLVLAVSSLKDPEAVAAVKDALAARRPDIVIAATAFSARDDAGFVLDRAECPVLQAFTVGSPRDAWAASARGLGASDLAMQVALPEFDGRLSGFPIAFKEEAPEVAGFAERRLVPFAAGIAALAERACGWLRLAALPAAERRVAVVMSDYPARGGRAGFAVGLDTPESARAVFADLAAAGYPAAPLPHDPMTSLTEGEPAFAVPLDDYTAWLATLPEVARTALSDAWGAPEDDPTCRDGAFRFRMVGGYESPLPAHSAGHRETPASPDALPVIAHISEAPQGSGTVSNRGGSLDCFAPLAKTGLETGQRSPRGGERDAPCAPCTIPPHPEVPASAGIA